MTGRGQDHRGLQPQRGVRVRPWKQGGPPGGGGVWVDAEMMCWILPGLLRREQVLGV